MKVNWDKVTVWEDLGRTRCRVQSLRKDFANLLYNKSAGLAYHALAVKIWNGDGNEDYSDEEVRRIRQAAEMCQPSIIDAIREMTDPAKEQ